MRVALLTFYPSDTRSIPGGIRMVSFNLVEGLKTFSDLDLHVVHCHSDIERSRTVSEENATIHYLALPRKRIVPNLMTSIGRIVRQVRAIDPDLVHAHAGHFAYAGCKSGYPTIYTIHGLLPSERRIYRDTLYDRLRYGMLAFYESRALQHVQQLVAISPYVCQEYSHIEASAWVRINNPVPRDFFKLLDRTEPLRVLYAGSITEVKDILTLLRAIERVWRVHPEVTLRVAGRVTSENYARRVRAYVAEHGLQDTVHFLGLLDRQAMMDEYARCALVALPSLRENAPMAIIEGMAAGKPVVATRVGGIPNLVSEGETGFMVPAGDDMAMAQSLGRLLGDTQLRKRMGQRAREVARERYSVDRVAQAYYDLYRRIAGQV